jgi:H+/gluconate symporter-like permease
MGLLGILVALGLLIWFAFRGWSVLLLAPAAALIAAAAAREPLLAHWTQTFMAGAASFLARFFPLFLLGALFGKLMDDSGSVQAIARFMTERLGPRRAMLAVVLAGAMLTYGGVSLFVAFFVLAPMAHSLFHAADIPRRLMPAAIVLGTSTFTMSALPGTPAIQNAIPMPFFGTTPFAALAAAVATVVAVNRSRLPALRESMDAGANASVLPAFSVASLVGFGAVVAALPAFAVVRDWVLSIGGGPLVSLAVATNVLAALTGSASGGMTIALDALGDTYMRLAAEADIDPVLLHRVAALAAGSLDSLPHNGAVVSLLAVCGLTHRESYFDMVIVGIVGALLGLLAVIVLGSAFGSF